MNTIADQSSLKFKIGDEVIFTNDYGCSFQRRITGYFEDTKAKSLQADLYANGYRYYLDSSSPWMPVKETALELATADNLTIIPGFGRF